MRCCCVRPTGSDLRRLVGPCGVAKRAPEGASLVLGYPEETGSWAPNEPHASTAAAARTVCMPGGRGQRLAHRSIRPGIGTRVKIINGNRWYVESSQGTLQWPSCRNRVP